MVFTSCGKILSVCVFSHLFFLFCLFIFSIFCLFVEKSYELVYAERRPRAERLVLHYCSAFEK